MVPSGGARLRGRRVHRSGLFGSTTWDFTGWVRVYRASRDADARDPGGPPSSLSPHSKVAIGLCPRKAPSRATSYLHLTRGWEGFSLAREALGPAWADAHRCTLLCICTCRAATPSSTSSRLTPTQRANDDIPGLAVLPPRPRVSSAHHLRTDDGACGPHKSD